MGDLCDVFESAGFSLRWFALRISPLLILLYDLLAPISAVVIRFIRYVHSYGFFVFVGCPWA